MARNLMVDGRMGNSMALGNIPTERGISLQILGMKVRETVLWTRLVKKF